MLYFGRLSLEKYIDSQALRLCLRHQRLSIRLCLRNHFSAMPSVQSSKCEYIFSGIYIYIYIYVCIYNMYIYIYIYPIKNVFAMYIPNTLNPKLFGYALHSFEITVLLRIIFCTNSPASQGALCEFGIYFTYIYIHTIYIYIYIHCLMLQICFTNKLLKHT